LVSAELEWSEGYAVKLPLKYGTAGPNSTHVERCEINNDIAHQSLEHEKKVYQRLGMVVQFDAVEYGAGGRLWEWEKGTGHIAVLKGRYSPGADIHSKCSSVLPTRGSTYCTVP
jgi:hypothetical protein